MFAEAQISITGQFLWAHEAVRKFLRRGMKPLSRALGKFIRMSPRTAPLWEPNYGGGGS